MNFFNALNRETDMKHDFRSGDLASEIDLTSDYFVDVSGFRVDWRNPEDGWDDRKRKDLLAIHRSNLEVPRLVPTLTENGELKSGLNDGVKDKKRSMELPSSKSTLCCIKMSKHDCNFSRRNGVTDVNKIDNLVNFRRYPLSKVLGAFWPLYL